MHTGFKGRHGVVAVGCGENHLHPCAQLRKQCAAIRTGQTQIQKHQIHRMAIQQPGGLLHAAGLSHHLHATVRLQQLLQALEGMFLIIYQQSAQEGHGHRSGKRTVTDTWVSF